MTTRLFLLILFTIAFNRICIAQSSLIQNKIYTAGSDAKRKIGIGFRIDSSTNVLTYFQNFTNLPNTFFNLIEKAKHIQFSVNYKSAATAEQYMYTLVDENERSISSGSFKELPYNAHTMGIEYLLPENKIEDKIISIIVYNKENPNIKTTSTIYNKPIQKQKINTLLWGTIGQKGYSLNAVDKKIELSTASAPLLVSMDKTPFDYIYTLLIKDINTNRVIYENQNWEYRFIESEEGSLPYMSIDKSILNKSGKYEFIIQPKLNYVDEKILSKYSTSRIIEIDWKNQYHFAELLIAILSTTTILLLIGFPIYRNWGRRKIQKENFQKRFVEAELKSIRTQLNPHFLYNALASIQSLVNTNEIEQANKYISLFSKLTRNVLDNQSYNTIQAEANLLTDYLEMEKLRHNFQFQIHINNDVNTQIEIPSMLLQPLLENAIIHGLESTVNDQIDIHFEKRNNDLIIQVRDNGKGYDSMKDFKGLGLKLTKERISLLNQIHKETPIHFIVDSNSTGTKISMNFQNWLI